MEDMWKYMAGGALVGVLGMIAGFWGKVKGVLWRIANLFVQQVEIPTEEAHSALVAYLIAHHKRSRMYDRMAASLRSTASTGAGSPAPKSSAR